MALDKDLKQIIDVVAEGATTIIEEMKDGFQYTDIFGLVPVFSKIPEAIKDANNALKYLEDLTPEKENEVIAAVLEKLKDTSDKTKQLVTYLLRTLANAYLMYKVLAKSEPVGPGQE